MFENLPKSVRIREVGARDGLQNEKAFVPTDIKKEFIRRLAAAGLKHIEITSFVNPNWIPPLADAAEIGKTFADMPGVSTNALVPNMKGLEGAEAAGIKEISLFMSATESHNKANVNKSISETLALYSELVPTAQAKGMRVGAGLSTMFGCPFEGLPKEDDVVAIIKDMMAMGIDRLGIADTIGVANPLQVKRMLAKITAFVDPELIGVHFHDTEGTAVANALACLEQGVTMFDGAVGGLGGCPYAPGATGNVATETLVFVFENMGIDTGIDREKLMDAGVFIQEQLGRTLDSSGLRAYLGRKARAAEKVAAG